jgi:chromosomal replication initiation ATPase DnaA
MNAIVPEALVPEYNRIILQAEHDIAFLVGKSVTIEVLTKGMIADDDGLRKLICDELCVAWDDLLRKNRRREIVTARQVYFFLAQKYLKKKDPDIASLFRMDRTNVVTGRQRVVDLLQIGDSIITNTINNIEKKLFKK